MKTSKYRQDVVSFRCLQPYANLKRCLQFHDIFISACELVHYFVLLFLALQSEYVLEGGGVARQQLVHLLPHLLPLLLLVIEITEEQTHFC